MGYDPVTTLSPSSILIGSSEAWWTPHCHWLNSILGISTAASALASAAVEMPRALFLQGSGQAELARTLVSRISECSAAFIVLFSKVFRLSFTASLIEFISVKSGTPGRWSKWKSAAFQLFVSKPIIQVFIIFNRPSVAGAILQIPFRDFFTVQLCLRNGQARDFDCYLKAYYS